jgi:hypothetical protein
VRYEAGRGWSTWSAVSHTSAPEESHAVENVEMQSRLTAVSEASSSRTCALRPSPREFAVDAGAGRLLALPEDPSSRRDDHFRTPPRGQYACIYSSYPHCHCASPLLLFSPLSPCHPSSHPLECYIIGLHVASAQRPRSLCFKLLSRRLPNPEVLFQAQSKRLRHHPIPAYLGHAKNPTTANPDQHNTKAKRRTDRCPKPQTPNPCLSSANLLLLPQPALNKGRTLNTCLPQLDLLMTTSS